MYSHKGFITSTYKSELHFTSLCLFPDKNCYSEGRRERQRENGLIEESTHVEEAEKGVPSLGSTRSSMVDTFRTGENEMARSINALASMET